MAIFQFLTFFEKIPKIFTNFEFFSKKKKGPHKSELEACRQQNHNLYRLLVDPGCFLAFYISKTINFTRFEAFIYQKLSFLFDFNGI